MKKVYYSLTVVFKLPCDSFQSVPFLYVNHEKDLCRIPTYQFVFCDNFVKPPVEDKWIILYHNHWKYVGNTNATFII